MFGVSFRCLLFLFVLSTVSVRGFVQGMLRVCLGMFMVMVRVRFAHSRVFCGGLSRDCLRMFRVLW